MSYVPISYQRYDFPSLTLDVILKNFHHRTCCPIHNSVQVHLESTENNDIMGHNIGIFKYSRCSFFDCGYLYNYYEVNAGGYKYLGSEVGNMNYSAQLFDVVQLFDVSDEARVQVIFSRMATQHLDLISKLCRLRNPEIRNEFTGLLTQRDPNSFKLVFLANPKDVLNFCSTLKTEYSDMCSVDIDTETYNSVKIRFGATSF